MHAIGTHVALDGVTTVPYRTNGKAPERLLRNLVVSLSQVGRHYFPQVYSVIRDTESDSGLPPVEPMDGADGPRVVPLIQVLIWAMHPTSTYTIPHKVSVCERKSCVVVVPTSFPSCQTFTVCFRMVYSLLAWPSDCTSRSKPDGPAGDRVGEGRHRNHLYGTFTASKERVVNAGRILSAKALQSKPPQASGDSSDDDGESSDNDCPFVGRKRQRRRRRKKKRRRGRCKDEDMPLASCEPPCPIEMQCGGIRNGAGKCTIGE